MKTALHDADILIYNAALRVEHEHRWPDGTWTYHADEQEGQDELVRAIDELTQTVNGTDFILALSDMRRNFRLDILPTYKGNRAGVRRPLLRKHLYEWLQQEYPAKCYMRPNLEGDDVLGILNTHPTLIKGDKVVVSLDKDFKTIPGDHYNQGKKQFFSINEEEAEWWHMYQTLAGDAADGYQGCPGVGPEAAAALCNAPYISTPYEHILKSGPRKGFPEVRFREEPTDDLWAAVVSKFKASGLSEEVALQQARVARILHWTDYDYKNRKPILWTPRSKKS